MIRKRVLWSVAAAGVAGTALAQQPPIALPTPNGPGAIPPLTAPFPPAPGPIGIAPGPELPTNNTLASFLGVSADQREFRHRQAARTPAGQLRSRFREPLTRLTGGLIPPLVPPTPTLAELQDPGAVGAAAKVKQDRAGADERMKAIQYLATVDCATWPEAEEALIGGLRADRNECVRNQAALVLGRGCCCTKKTIKALEQAASGEDCDGFPREKSARVRAAAQAALEKCCCCFVDVQSNCPDKAKCNEPPTPPEPEPVPVVKPTIKEKEKEKAPDMLPEREKPAEKAAPAKDKDAPVKTAGGKVDPKSYYEWIDRRKGSDVVAEARKVLYELGPINYIEGSSVNPLDLQAAGFPSSVDARTQSPKAATLLEALTREEPIATASTVVPAPAPVWRPAATAKSAAVVTAGAVQPVSWKPTAAPSAVVPAGGVPAPAPVSKAAPVIRPVSAVVPAAPAKPAAPAVKLAPAATRVLGKVPTGSPAEMKAALGQMSAADFKANPNLAAEMAKAAKSSADAGVRLAYVQALVRGRTFTPPVVAAFKDLTADSAPDVRAEADLGVALADALGN